LRTYEIIFILDERQVEDGGKQLASQIEEKIQSLGGNLKKTEAMGRKQFARPMNKRITSGIYWDFVVEFAPDKVAEFKAAYKLDNRVLRLAIFNHEEPQMPTEAAMAETD
jgi:ribosomal protein S6